MKKREIVYNQNISIYVLQLENDCYYIGQSINVERRLEEHRQGQGASFTKLNPVRNLIEVFVTETNKLIEAEVYEDFFVMKYIEQHGAEKVKGGTFLQSSKKRESRFRFYRNLFLEAKECKNAPKAFFEKVSSIRVQGSVKQVYQ
ncbi:GIY-YIG nuclease family protein [Nostoc sp. FACHB-190]|uniref:GIY-YIG nuclease family protein n=1 Tax=Nostoc sp. FACHB-190 TaxID=2692838 RepID=UPI001688D3E2|nr:GIY-YIG nuclease family protein [Nostoc sp. FACHB-190]MBD2303683.1 GIY-YIG nuclease family protein [Nostoc sp. FACHB-190]